MPASRSFLAVAPKCQTISWISSTVKGREVRLSAQRFGVAEAEAQAYWTSTMGLASLFSRSFLPSAAIQGVTAIERPKPPASWMNSLLPVL